MRTVFDYGAVGDGAADDTAAFQAAATDEYVYAPATRPEGGAATYSIRDTITLAGGHVIIEGTIDATQMPPGETWGEGVLFRAWGAEETSTSYSTRIPKGTSTLTSTNAFTPGDLLIIRNGQRPVKGMTRTDRSKGELKRVQEASPEQFQVSARTYFEYASPSTITPISPVDVHFSGGGTILCGGVGSGHTAISIKYGVRPTIRDLTIIGAEDTGIALNFCWAPRVENCRIEDCTSPVYGNTGYGILLGAGVVGGHVSGCTLFNCRHGVAGGGEIPAMFCSVDRCFADNATLDCHEPAFEWQFLGNTVVGGVDGLLLRGQHSDAVLNRFHGNSGSSVRVKTWDQVTVQDGNRSLFNRVRSAGKAGVEADGRATSLEPISYKPGLEIIGDRVEESGRVSDASVIVTHATESMVYVTTRSNVGSTGVEIGNSRLRSLAALGDDAATPVKLTNCTFSSNTTSEDKGS